MKPSLSQYINRRLGGTKGEIAQLKYMLKHSFSAPNFRSFWIVWNPIFSYVLLYYVYKPIRRLLPSSLAQVITFVVNGLFHDFMVYLIMGVKGFTVTRLFGIYGVLVLIEGYLASKVIIKNKAWASIYNAIMLLLPIIIVINI